MTPLRALAALLPLCLSCASGRVRVPMMRPAEVNLPGVQTLAITSMTGQGASLVSGLLEEQLVKGGRFQILDREHVDSLMSELKLSSSDLADAKAASRLGKLMTAGAIINGHLEESYTETPHARRFTDKKGREHTHRSVEAELVMRGTFKVTDVSTGQVVVAKTVEAKRGSSRLEHAATQVLGALFNAAVDVDHDTEDPPPDRAKLEDEARTELVGNFIRAIAPQQELVEVSFALDGDLPQLQQGMNWAKHGDWTKAQQLFADAIHAAEISGKISNKTLAKAYYDQGLSYEYAGDYDKAIPSLQKAFDLTFDDKFLDEIDNTKRLQSEAKKLAAQTSPPAAK